MLPRPPAVLPALTMERELAKVAALYDRPTADIVALAMEYRWAGKGEATTQ
jgi:hypothetical protein